MRPGTGRQDKFLACRCFPISSDKGAGGGINPHGYGLADLPVECQPQQSFSVNLKMHTSGLAVGDALYLGETEDIQQTSVGVYLTIALENVGIVIGRVCLA